MEPHWLRWARELQALAQTGLAFTDDRHDRERYEAARRVAAEIMAYGSGIDERRIEAVFAEQQGYATPKVDVRGAVFRDDTVVLVREVADEGRWTLPGGWADVNESPAEAVAREVREEAGLDVVARKLAAVYDRSRHPHLPVHPFHTYKLFFVCEIVGGSPHPGAETSEVAFFAEDHLPVLSASRVLDYQVRRMFQHARTAELPTDFD